MSISFLFYVQIYNQGYYYFFGVDKIKLEKKKRWFFDT
jgi:hypothetical protein